MSFYFSLKDEEQKQDTSIHMSRTVVPHNITIKTRTPSFMLSSINGRNHLDKLENNLNRPCSLCTTSKDCIRRCVQCNMQICEVCIRTSPIHNGHPIETIIGKQSGRLDEFPQAPAMSYCNECGCAPLTTPYYHCTTCDDYDLCDVCFGINNTLVKRTNEMLHDPKHPMVQYYEPPKH